MAKAAPSKKTAKAVKASAGGEKKKTRKRARKETFGSYIHKVLKQVHPGACRIAQPPPRMFRIGYLIYNALAVVLTLLLRCDALALPPTLQRRASPRRA